MVFRVKAIMAPLFEDVKTGNRLDRGTGGIVEWRRIIVRIARGYPGGWTKYC